MRKQKVLFLCTQNSARSQMAEGFLREHGGDRFVVYSAGCRVGDEIHPYAVEAMEEVGIDISDQYPKGLKTYMGKMGFNYSIIVCARAEIRVPQDLPRRRHQAGVALRRPAWGGRSRGGAAGEVPGDPGRDRAEDPRLAGAPRGGVGEATS